MKEKHLLVDRGIIVEVDGRFYVPASKAPLLICQQGFLPIHFVSTKTSKVYADSPAIGMEEFGPWEQDALKGPFFELEEANAFLQERQNQTDKTRYEFLGKIVSRAIPVNGSLPSDIPTYRYYREGCELAAGKESRVLHPNYDISNEQVETLYNLLRQRAETKAEEKKEITDENTKGLLAMIENEGRTLIRLVLDERGPLKRFTLKSFSDERKAHHYSTDLIHLGIDYRAFHIHPVLEFLSLTRLNFSIDDNLEDIPQKNDLIF